jgi:hypothetical protein
MIHNIFKDIAPMLLKLSPTVASALGSPVAGAALQILADKFGGDIAAPTDLVEKIKSHPDAEHVLTDIEKEHCDGLQCLIKDSKIKSIELNFKMNIGDE